MPEHDSLKLVRQLYQVRLDSKDDGLAKFRGCENVATGRGDRHDAGRGATGSAAAAKG